MSLFPKLFAGAIAATVMTSTVATAQNLEVKRYNPSEWTKTFFTEIITVNGPGEDHLSCRSWSRGRERGTRKPPSHSSSRQCL